MTLRNKLIGIATSSIVCGTIFVGCGAGDSLVNSITSGKLVDPYISGAVLCQDTNGNNTCDDGELTSSTTTADGTFSFSSALTPGKNIIIKTQGLHEGKTYDLNISGIVASDGSIDVVSPLTTLECKGLDASQIAIILTKAKTDAIANDGATNLASFDINSSTILSDPIGNNLVDKNVSVITDADLANLQASLSTYALLKIMEGSTTLSDLNGTALYTSGTTTGAEVNLIARGVLKSVSDGLNKTLLTNIKTGIDGSRSALVTAGLDNTTANTALPEPTVSMIVKVAVSITDRLASVGYTTCNTTAGNDSAKVAAALNAVSTEASTISNGANILALGKRFYSLKHKDTISTNLPSLYLTNLKNADASLKVGLEVDDNVTTFKFNTNGSIVTHVAGASDTNTSDTNTSTSQNSPVSGLLVDPYISGAILCQDTNGNNSCDSDEPTSTSTDTNGSFTFSSALTSGKNIIIKTHGVHEGKTYDLNISGVVDSNGTISVVSPLTTFRSRGLTASQIGSILTKAKTDAIANDSATNLASFDVNVSTLLDDPLSGNLMNKTVSNITDVELSNLRSSLSAYGLLKIMNGSTSLAALNGTALLTSGTTTNSPVNLIARSVLKSVSDGLNTALLTSIKTGIDQGRSALVTAGLDSATAANALPEPPVSMIVKVAVAIIDRLAQTGYDTCNSTSGDDNTKVTAALTAVGTQASSILTNAKVIELGEKFYGMTYKNTITSNLASGYLSGLKTAKPSIKVGLEVGSGVTTFKFDNSGNIVTHSN